MIGVPDRFLLSEKPGPLVAVMDLRPVSEAPMIAHRKRFILPSG